jgi:hypothetical protein
MRHRHPWARRALLILAAGAVVAGVWTTIPTAAAAPAPLRAPVDASVTPTQSFNWAGYADKAPASSVTSVSGAWSEPSVSCPSKGTYYAVFWVGIDGYNSKTVEQTGTQAVCSDGGVSYSAWWELYPLNSIRTISGFTVRPGDSIAASVTFSGSSFAMKITDSTRGETFTKTATQKSTQRSSAECVAERPAIGGSLTKLADFGSMTFSSCKATISGTGVGIGAYSDAVKITMVDRHGTVLAVPSSTTGSTFSVTWEASS